MKANTRKILIIAGIAIALFALWYFLIRKKTQIVSPSTVPYQPKTSNGSELNKGKIRSLLPNAEFPLQIGSKGQQVQHIQIALNLNYGENLSTDGIFGPLTQDAINKHFSNWNGKVTYLNYISIYNRYGAEIQNYLKNN